MRYSKSFIPTQAFNPCTWCYYESNLPQRMNIKRVYVLDVTITFVNLRMQCGNTKDVIIIFKDRKN